MAAKSEQVGSASVRDYFALLKPRVMSLVVFTASVAFLVAPGSLSPAAQAAAILLIALGAGAAGALNMWWESDIDAMMARTAHRPLPSGRVDRHAALLLGLGLAAVSVPLMGLVSNPFAGALLAFTIFFYVVVYTMWLKRRTPLNIVIGGAAGALPPVIGWVAATGRISIAAVLMFAVIFLWTPAHFWSLALFVRSDYHRAGLPMLTVTHGTAATRRHILAYVALLGPAAIWLGLSAVGGPVTTAIAMGASALFFARATRLCRRTDAMARADGFEAERSVFRFSLTYLALVFGGLLADATLRAAGLL